MRKSPGLVAQRKRLQDGGSPDLGGVRYAETNATDVDASERLARIDPSEGMRPESPREIDLTREPLRLEIRVHEGNVGEQAVIPVLAPVGQGTERDRHAAKARCSAS